MTELRDIGVHTNQHIDESVQHHLHELQMVSRKPGIGTDVHSRMAHVDSILGDAEAYATLRALRWPEKVICPRCHSDRVVLRKPPQDAIDAFKEYYDCLDCKSIGRESEFDDLTGIELNEAIASIRTWMMCWYLSHFCPTKLISAFLHLDPYLLAQMIGTVRHIEVEKREQEEQRLELELKLHKDTEQTSHYADSRLPSFSNKIREAGAVFSTDKETISAADERNKERAGAPTFKERLGKVKPTPKG